jgi:hypothetical protein
MNLDVKGVIKNIIRGTAYQYTTGTGSALPLAILLQPWFKNKI